MNDNREQISRAVDYIEAHLQDETLDLNAVTAAVGYFKYHWHRLFTALTGVPVHRYIQRRRMSEAARRLVFTADPILRIALDSGYQTQRSFSRQFQAVYHCSPKTYRRKKLFLPLQPRLELQNSQPDALRNFKIQIRDEGAIALVGYCAELRHGFGVIGRSWQKLHQNKSSIPGRCDSNFLIGVHDYTEFSNSQKGPMFTYWAWAQVELLSDQAQSVPKGMRRLTLPASRYVVFEYQGRCQDSLEPVIELIYNQWFPSASCQLNENARYDLIRYGESTNDQGLSDIQIEIPIL